MKQQELKYEKSPRNKHPVNGVNKSRKQCREHLDISWNKVVYQVKVTAYKQSEKSLYLNIDPGK